jgi:hypothetical protein
MSNADRWPAAGPGLRAIPVKKNAKNAKKLDPHRVLHD